MARGDRDLGKEQFWREVLRRWRMSKRTLREFCTEQRLSEACFYAWRRIIGERDQKADRARPKSRPHTEEMPAFVPLRVTPAPAPTNSVLEVVLAPGRVIRVPPGFDAGTLQRLLAVLEGPSC